MERPDRAAVATFFAAGPLAAGATVTLDESEAQHVRVRRLTPGDRVRLVNGEGGMGWGALARLERREAAVELDGAEQVAPFAALHLILPVADRERMLWLGEKATELALASWRPVLWQRSRSVSPRGEGPAFAAKLRARMISALTQSGGAWLPAIHAEASPEGAAADSDSGTRILLDQEGDALLSLPLEPPITLAVGPEGGLEPEERAVLMSAGFRPARLAPLTLRFETAAVAALAVARAALTPSPKTTRA